MQLSLLCEECAYPVTALYLKAQTSSGKAPRDGVLREMRAFALDAQVPAILSFPISFY